MRNKLWKKRCVQLNNQMFIETISFVFSCWIHFCYSKHSSINPIISNYCKTKENNINYCQHSYYLSTNSRQRAETDSITALNLFAYCRVEKISLHVSLSMLSGVFRNLLKKLTINKAKISNAGRANLCSSSKQFLSLLDFKYLR